MGLGKDTAFLLFDMALEQGQYQLVSDTSLDVLSSQFASSDHQLLLVHSVKNMLTYLTARVMPQLAGDRVYEAATKRFHAYRNLVFTPFELSQIDGRTAEAATASARAAAEAAARKQATMETPLLCAIRHVPYAYSIEDLIDLSRARRLLERPIEQDKVPLARCVWVEVEGRLALDFDSEVMPKVDKLEASLREAAHAK